MKSYDHISSSGQRPPGRSVARRQPRPFSRRTTKRFGKADKATEKSAIRLYREELDRWRASSFACAMDGEDMFLPDTLFRHLTCALEFYDLPVARYEAWRTRDPADACLRLVALTKLGMSDERAEQIEKALFSLRPADEISAVGWREIRAVLSAHRIFREAQRDEVDRERPSITSLAS